MDILSWNMRTVMSLFLIQGIVNGVTIDVKEGSTVTIQCPLNIQYPTWTGPEGLADPLTTGDNNLEPGITWVNNKDLKIAKTMLKHDGNYTCSDGNGNDGTVEVDVQYFAAWAEVTPASPENTTTVLSCWCQSNPKCKIVPHTVSNVRHGQDMNKDSSITFKPCEPKQENRTRCSVVAVMHVSKEDNGQQMRCDIDYKKTVTRIYQKVKFMFPCTIVKITTEQVSPGLTFNCSTDSSNPVSSLTWRRGSKPLPWTNTLMLSNYQSYVTDGEYNGKKITQAIDVKRDSIQNGEKLLCCTSHRCDTIDLDVYQISGASSNTAGLVLLFAGIVFLKV